MDSKAIKSHRRFRWTIVFLGLAIGTGRAPAEDLPWGAYLAQSSFLPANAPRLSYIKTDVEVRRTSYKVTGGSTTVWDETILIPAAGITWQNYIFHPYLLNYSLLFEQGYYWQRVRESSSRSKTRQLMQNGNVVVNLLAAKPYNISISYGRSHSDVQADFFSSQTLDRESWNLVTGYRAGPTPVTLTFEKTRDDRSSDSQEYITNQLKVGLRAINDRKKGNMTTFDYQYFRYANQSNSNNSSYSSESDSHRVLLIDTERFEKSSLSTSLNLNERDTAGFSSTDLNAFANYNLAITPHLNNFYIYSLSSGHASGFSSMVNSLTAGLDHQLYESLFSHLDLHGSYADNDSSGAKFRSETNGLAASVGYSKRLGDWGHLSATNAVAYDRVDQRSGGGEITISNESYTIPAVGPMIIRLKTPTDVAITSITKNNAVLDPTEWRAVTTSDPWQIQFLAGGAHSLANGDAVLITYVVQPNPSGNYATHSYTGEVAFRFWRDQAGVRASYTTTGNNTDSAAFVLQSINQYQLGADVGWGGLHADASYTHLRSNLYSYQIRALSEGYSVQLSPRSSFGINCYQQWSDFPAGSGSSASQDQKLEFYSYMLNYGWRPPGAFNLNAEAGLQQQRGTLQDQDLFAARVYLNWMFSKFEIHLGFERENRQYLRDEFTRNYAFLRVRRGF